MKYLGIDIGDGESAITVVAEDGEIVPSVIKLGHAGNIRSIVGNLGDQPIIGDSSVLNPAVTNRSVRFKSRFLRDPSAQEDVRRFASGLYHMMRQSVADPDLNIALGCPADWPQEARERYAAVISSAGFSNIHTVSESRAAYLYVHYCKEMNLSEEALSKPTLVIDIGSSTLDYAYIVNGKERNVGVFGDNHLGGGILDALILEHAVKQSPDGKRIREIFEKYPSWKNYCELTAREVKEMYFSNEDAYAENACQKYREISASANNSYILTVGLIQSTVETLLDQPMESLGGKSFRAALHESLENAKVKTTEYPVEQIIMTGGASRMRFFRKMCEEIFLGVQVLYCPEPEFSIARGLGIAARLDEQLKQFRDKVHGYFDSGVVRTTVRTNLPSLMEDYLPLVYKIFRKKKWVTDIESSLIDPADQNAINRFLRQKAEELIQNDEKLVEKADSLVNAWIGTGMKPVQEGLDNLCDQYKIKKTDMSLVEIHNSIRLDRIRVPLIVRFLYSGGKQNKLKMLFRQLGGGIINRNMNSAIKKQLQDPHGEFALTLGNEIQSQLLEQIEEQISRVEFNI